VTAARGLDKFPGESTFAENQRRSAQSQANVTTPISTKHLCSLAALALALLAGCATEPAASAPQESTKYTVENTEKFSALDDMTAAHVNCTGLQEHRQPDGKLEVVANIRNRAREPLAVQVRCVFRDEQGFATGDDVPWQTVTLGPKATEVLNFRATLRTAKKYTIQVRTVPAGP
jgi:uncharacterized protein YcfL